MEKKEKKSIKADSFVDTDRSDREYSLLDSGEIRRKKNLEEYYKTYNNPADSKDIRKYLLVTDKIIDREL